MLAAMDLDPAVVAPAGCPAPADEQEKSARGTLNKGNRGLKSLEVQYLPRTRSDAAVSASLIVAQNLRRAFAVPRPRLALSRCRSARTTCLRWQPIVANRASRMRHFSIRLPIGNAPFPPTPRRAPMLIFPAIDDTDPIR